jgi:hypothetical protein
VWISELTAIISLYSINWLVFRIETECVYCAVRAGSQTAIISLYSINREAVCLLCSTDWIYKYSSCYRSFLNMAVSWFRRSVGGVSLRGPAFNPRSVRVRFMVYKEALWQVFLAVLLFFLSVSFHQCTILIITYMYDSHKDRRAKPGNPPKSNGCQIRGSIWQKSAVTFLSLLFKRDVEWVNKPRDEPVTRDWEEANSTDSNACGRSVWGVDVTRCPLSAVCAFWLAIQWRSVIAVVWVATCKCSNFTHQLLQRPL